MKRSFPSTIIHPVVIFSILLAAVLLSPQEASAQLEDLKKGDFVRVWSPQFSGGKTIGTIEFMRSQSMVIYSRDSTLTISYASIERIDLSVSKKRQTLKGFLIGLGGGALFGALVGSSTYSPCVPEELFDCIFAAKSRSDAAGRGAIIGGVMFGIIGLVVGSQTKKPRWHEIPLHLNPTISFKTFQISNNDYSPGIVLTWNF